MTNNLLTTEATLKIWRGLPEESQRTTVKKWQEKTGNKWTFEMVSTSTITLKRILTAELGHTLGITLEDKV